MHADVAMCGVRLWRLARGNMSIHAHDRAKVGGAGVVQAGGDEHVHPAAANCAAFSGRMPPAALMTSRGCSALSCGTSSASCSAVGEFLLVDALRRSLEAAQQIAAMAVVVDAKGVRAESLYRHFDFQPFQQTPLRLFLPMAQIAVLFA